MKIKENVKLNGLNSVMVLAIMVIKDVYKSYNVELVITSATDGKHGRGSLHYVGNGLDIRTKTLRSEDIHPLASEIRENLGKEFDVIVEKTHIHVEFQPK